jgi:iron complex outermembrane receptor protein
MNFRLTRVAQLLAVVPLWAMTATYAQDTAETEAAEARTRAPIDEVVVTAQRREERLIDVPLAVTALSTDQLESRGISNIHDLSSRVPGLQINSAPSNTTISQISIRGITQINPAIYWDPAVGVYLDGIYIGKSQGAIFDVVDLERIEVLRGPQGTLYGRNTLAGAINLISKRPSGEFGGHAALEVGNFNAMTQKASVDLPRMGIANISIAARSERRDGWIDTSLDSPVRAFNNRNNDGLRLAADFDIAPGVLAEYRYDRSTVDQSNNFQQLVRASPAFWDFVGFPEFPDFVSTNRETFAQVDAPSFERARIMGHGLTFSWNVNDLLTLRSLTGYRRLEWADSLDLDGSPLPIAFTQRFTNYDQISQDFQAIGTGQNWNYVAGLYYFGDDGSTNNPQQFFAGTANFDSRYATRTDAWSVYGQFDYRPIDPLTLTAGIRYTREKKELDRAFGVAGAPGDPFFYLIPEGTQGEDTFSATTPVFSVAYKFNRGFNVYARYAEGFKSGGFNGEFSQPPVGGETPEEIGELIELNIAETQTPFRPEKQRSFEIGSKAVLPGGQWQVNTALFYNRLDDLQTSTFLGTGAAASVIRNAGEATIRGAELEIVYSPFDGTQIYGSYTYLDAKYDEFIDAGVNQADNRAFVQAPENAFNLVIDSRLATTDWGEVRATLDYAHTGAFYTYPYQLASSGPDFNPAAQVAANSRVESRGILNARLALAEIRFGATAVGELAFWVRNLTDVDKASNFIDFGPAFGDLTIANFVEPRAYGVAGIVRW